MGPKEKMKCFIVLATLAMASAAPQYFIADTPEVQAAKAQFSAAYNAAAQRNTIAPVVQAAPVYEDGQTWPEAEAYIHEDIAAEAYVHLEPAFKTGPVAPAAPVFQAAAPVAPAAPVLQAAAPVNYNFAPVDQATPVWQQSAQVAQVADTPEVQAAKAEFAAAYSAALQRNGIAPAPVAPSAPVREGCFNWKGQSVQCRV